MAASSYSCYFEDHPVLLATDSHQQQDENFEFVSILLQLSRPTDLEGIMIRHQVSVAEMERSEGGLVSELSAHLSDLGVPERSWVYKFCFDELVRREQDGLILGMISWLRFFRVPEGYHAKMIALLMHHLFVNDMFPLTVVMVIVEPSDTVFGGQDDVAMAVSRSMDEYEAWTVQASEDVITRLKKVQVQPGFYCVICMDYEDDDKLGLSRMPCEHVFHSMCIETWLRINSVCPLCRYSLPT